MFNIWKLWKLETIDTNREQSKKTEHNGPAYMQNTDDEDDVDSTSCGIRTPETGSHGIHRCKKVKNRRSK